MTKERIGFTITIPVEKWFPGRFPSGTRFCGKRGGHRCSSVMLPRGYSYFANGWGILCAALRPDGRTTAITAYPPSFAWQTVVFLYLFLEKYRKEMADMTMPKREVNSIWAKVRDDVDIDDLIFNYEAYHTGEDDGCSDR